MFPRIYTAQNSAEAGVVISFLRAEGFHPLDLQTSPSFMLGGGDLFYHVQLPAQEVEAAIEALKVNGYGEGITYQSDEPNAG